MPQLPSQSLAVVSLKNLDLTATGTTQIHPGGLPFDFRILKVLFRYRTSGVVDPASVFTIGVTSPNYADLVEAASTAADPNGTILAETDGESEVFLSVAVPKNGDLRINVTLAATATSFRADVDLVGYWE